jgi:hypothetical protein
MNGRVPVDITCQRKINDVGSVGLGRVEVVKSTSLPRRLLGKQAAKLGMIAKRDGSVDVDMYQRTRSVVEIVPLGRGANEALELSQLLPYKIKN